MKRIIYLLGFLLLLNNLDAQIYRFKANKEYKKVVQGTSIEQHREFIRNFPKSKHLPEIKNRLYSLQIRKDYDSVFTVDEFAAYSRFYTFYSSKDTSQYVKDLVEISPYQMLLNVKHKMDEINTWEELEYDYYKYDTDTTEYHEFITNFPDSKFIDRAKAIIAFRKQLLFWQEIEDSYSIPKYQEYLTIYPDGEYVDEANSLIQLCAEWDSVKSVNTHQAYAKFADENEYTVFYDSARLAMKDIEYDDWMRACRKNTYYAYDRFEKKYPDGYYFYDAERKIYDLSKKEGWLMIFSLRDPDYTSITVYNTLSVPLTMRFSGARSYRIVVAPTSEKTIKVKNGYYNITNSAPGYVTDYDKNLLFSGFDVKYAVYDEDSYYYWLW